jgi:poly-gamma-glutamate capsule biosynthesis protein CapA/YwtB (metallophosphatase superfamily)
MNAHPSPPARGLFGRPILTATIALAALAGAGLGGVAVANRGNDLGAPRWQQPSAPATSADHGASPSASGAATTDATDGDAITLSATGDIIMGSAPNRLPANGGEGFFDSVRSALKSDLVMGNLEQPLTGDTGSSKCGSPPRPNCFAFRAPPAYAEHLKDAGFDLLNTANNHSRDFGATGYRNTRAALEAQDLAHTGGAGQITTVDVKGVDVAVLGFSSYAGANSLVDLAAARRVVQEAAEKADVVVVQVHMGAEGSDKGHVRPGTEMFFGENRGDPMKFARTVVDAGADLVVGHGPHVLRGMEFYEGRLIAYSLGNFAGGGNTLSNAGVLKYSGILKVKLTRDGEWADGSFLSTVVNSAGLPIRDKANERGRALVEKLSSDDFGDTAARISDDGSISPPS